MMDSKNPIYLSICLTTTMCKSDVLNRGDVLSWELCGWRQGKKLDWKFLIPLKCNRDVLWLKSSLFPLVRKNERKLYTDFFLEKPQTFGME